ncbi:MAG: outer membrane protein assembly factor BamA [Gemmatimonadaceae bacterium]|nr:outer membrane protein assembly factor BamA [Gemmatimonadaceae bacterium]MDQ3519663.1 outer membrane protein assembly factor BamA [Gemmatimonadota bacterium]
MRRLYLFAALLFGAATPILAQRPPSVCAIPDSIIVRGNTRVSDGTIRADAGIRLTDTLNHIAIQRAIAAVFASGQFDDVRIVCEPDADGTRSSYVIEVRERPVLGDVAVTGVKNLSNRTVKERVDLLIGRAIDPSQVARVVQRIDSLYEAEGYFLATVRPETTVTNGKTKLTFRIDEGRRLAVAGIVVEGNKRLSDGEVVGAMKTRPEGFWWFRRGGFDEDAYAADIGDRIPKRYATDGFVDFQVTQDTLVVDRDRGKALIRVTVDEGPRYRVGSFEVVGNRRFSSEEIARFFPFTKRDPSVMDRLKGVIGKGTDNTNAFNQAEWDEAIQRVNTAYYNEGYIQARVTPVVDRVVTPDSLHAVNLRWEIQEGSPATINKIEIGGNDYTTEACIRDQLVILPGDVFNYDRLIRSYQNIGNLGFFEQPMPFPDTRPANDKGDIDIVFNVKEKQTGSVNFGASMGQGTGVGGFLGLDQPNVFGQCKRVSLNWQFGRYLNDFQLSFTDPSIRQSRISGTLSAYHTRSRFTVADLGRTTRSGGSLQFGFPVRWSPYTRVFLSYGGEQVKSNGGLFDRDTLPGLSRDGFRSTVGVSTTHDTRIDMPFASAGGMQTLSAQFNGGPLGGSANFQRYTGEMRAYAPLGQFGGEKPGSQPVKFVLGLTTRAGTVFGDVGPFLVSQKFALGGTQYGELLRGYDEFSISPQGYVTGTSTTQARRESFGNAFLSTTAEVGLRLNQQVYANVFFDAGNVWNRPRDFDPTRLFRGAGIGVALITPLGPLGLDWAYGFDRLDALGRPDPKWQLHFRLGNIF